MANDDAQGVLITRGSARRIKRVVDRFDGSGRPPAPRGLGGAPYNPGVQRARVTTAIPAGTEASPSSTGKVKLKVRDPAGAWGDGEEVQVWSDFGGDDIDVGTMVRVGWIAGQWWIVSASC